MSDNRRLVVLLGNQLFPPECLAPLAGAHVFMAEDHGLCTYFRHHQQKIVLFIGAMRSYRDDLRSRGFQVHYHELSIETDNSYEERLEACVDSLGTNELVHFEIEDKQMEQRIREFADAKLLSRTEMPSPMFLCSRERFRSFVDSTNRLLMADFYRLERRRLGVLVDADGNPAGGHWSFDAENRKKLPKSLQPPILQPAPKNKHVDDVIKLVHERFPDHPGDAAEFWWPSTRAEALNWLKIFMETRFENFGPYEDAISTRSETVFHSLLSPSLNIGLLIPREIVDTVLTFAQENDVPIASVEGFIRQVIGWREFIRGIYQNFNHEQESRNFWDHKRELTDDWYTGTTGIPPLDDAINTAERLGWTHHIPRLMVIANMMTLCEIRPTSAHRWFMEMFVDSSDWVMGPNVYGMGLFSDGGIFATKPYICGSNYWRKMSDYKNGEWCDTVDGLYWRFIEKHRNFFERHPRLRLISKGLDRLDAARKRIIFDAAEAFLKQFTTTRSAETI